MSIEATNGPLLAVLRARACLLACCRFRPRCRFRFRFEIASVLRKLSLRSLRSLRSFARFARFARSKFTQ
eukprot:6287569-Alexandrium_andersonii.AAC.1